MAESANPGAETRYKIGDVCRIADVQPYVLRYWESEFPVLAPDKAVAGPRTYSGRELKLIEQIKRLLYDEGYTIAGAKKRLEGEAGGKPEAKDAKADTKPAVAPIPSEKAEDPKKAEKPEKSLREPRPKAPALASASKFELPAPEITQPVVRTPAGDRVAHAVAELKEVLALLSRREP